MPRGDRGGPAEPRRSFVDRVDFVIPPRWDSVTGPGSRERLGLTWHRPPEGHHRPGGSSSRTRATCELTLAGLYPELTVADVQAKTGW